MSAATQSEWPLVDAILTGDVPSLQALASARTQQKQPLPSPQPRILPPHHHTQPHHSITHASTTPALHQHSKTHLSHCSTSALAPISASTHETWPREDATYKGDLPFLQARASAHTQQKQTLPSPQPRILLSHCHTQTSSQHHTRPLNCTTPSTLKNSRVALQHVRSLCYQLSHAVQMPILR